MSLADDIIAKTQFTREPDPDDPTCIVLTIRGIAPKQLRPVKPLHCTGAEAVDEIKAFAARILGLKIVEPTIPEGSGIGDA